MYYSIYMSQKKLYTDCRTVELQCRETVQARFYNIKHHKIDMNV